MSLQPQLVKQFLLIGALATAFGIAHGLIGGFEMPKEAKTTVSESILKSLQEAKEQKTSDQTEEIIATPIEAITPPPAKDSTVEQASSGESEQSDFPVELLHDFWTTENAIFLDARTKDEFTESHIPRSYHLPLEAFSGSVPEILQVFPTDQTFIVYCGGGDCHASHSVGALMIDLGYENVLVYEGGFPTWTAAGYPVEKGYFQ